MYSDVTRAVENLISNHDPDVLAGRRVGLERECLRVDGEGRIAQSDHPQTLGAPLTHPHITTDFSEALIEMVTPPVAGGTAALGYLENLHRYVARKLENGEIFWNTSMPCLLDGSESVRIGQYGSSHNGVMKHVYRRGLALRYGRRMQAIAGIHFNFSMPDAAFAPGGFGKASGPDGTPTVTQDDITRGYFRMTQNLQRIGWLVPYLFGASPAVCPSFLGEGEGEELERFGNTRFAPEGTSLRMGRIGYRYRDDEPINLAVRHTCFEDYVGDIIDHVTAPHPPYEKLGLHDASGALQQLSVNRLQIENEFYSSVRPKQIPERGEFPIMALKRRGIRYLELRSLDVNLFHPAGLDVDTVAAIELLMLHCWLADPHPLDATDMVRIAENMRRVAHDGRQPGLELETSHGTVALADWARDILEPLRPLAAWLDRNETEPRYVRALDTQLARVEDPSLTPSARMLEQVFDTGSFSGVVLALSRRQHEAHLAAPLDAAFEREMDALAASSLADQSALEAASSGSFEAFLTGLFAQLGGKQ